MLTCLLTSVNLLRLLMCSFTSFASPYCALQCTSSTLTLYVRLYFPLQCVVPKKSFLFCHFLREPFCKTYVRRFAAGFGHHIHFIYPYVLGYIYISTICARSVAFCSLKHKLSARCAIVVAGARVLCAKFFNARLNFHNMLITASHGLQLFNCTCLKAQYSCLAQSHTAKRWYERRFTDAHPVTIAATICFS